MKNKLQTKRNYLVSALVIAVLLAFIQTAAAQTTAFNFQGRLNDGTSPANGRYDLEFRLYNAITGGTQVGATISKSNLMLVNGVFSTQLNFGDAAFDSNDRFIEISLRQTASGATTPNAFVILGPRQQILAVPYSIRSLRATYAEFAQIATISQDSLFLGGVPATNYLLKNGNGSQLTNVTAVNSQQLGGVAAIQYVQNDTPGTVKAMLFYETSSSLPSGIIKCYNATLSGSAATTPPCGFTVNRFTPGGFGINFGFSVRQSIMSLTTSVMHSGADEVNTGIYWKYPFPNPGDTSIDVRTYKSGESTTTVDPSNGFSVIIYY